MAALPYMQLYVADYLADTPHLTTEEHGAYLLLLFSYWQTAKPLRVNRLAAAARLSNERWTDVERALKEFFTEVDGCWIHPRVEKDLENVAIKAGKNSKAGKASAAARLLVKQQLEENQQNLDLTNVPTNVEHPLNKRSTTRNGSTIEEKEKEKEKEQDQDQKKPPTPKTKKPKLEFVLPDWIDPKAWSDYVDMRKQIKKPITENAKALAVGALKRFAEQGHNPNAILNQSTLNSWQGLFEVKNGKGQNSATGSPRRPSLVEQVDQAAIQRQQREAAQQFASGTTFDFDEDFAAIDFDG